MPTSPFNIPVGAFPGLPGFTLPGLPSGLGIAVPGLSVNQPGLPSLNQLVAQAFNALNALAGQNLSNPLAAPLAPLAVPSAIAAQMGTKLQSGTLQPKFTNITTPLSGAWIQLQPTTTLIVEGQLYNAAPSGVSLSMPPLGATQPDPGSAIPVAAGGTFNFGPIDLNTVWVSNTSNNNKAQVNLYMEQ